MEWQSPELQLHALIAAQERIVKQRQPYLDKAAELTREYELIGKKITKVKAKLRTQHEQLPSSSQR